MSGRIEAIHVAAKSGAVVESRDSVETCPKRGLIGDRNEGGKPETQVTIVAQEQLAEAAEACGHAIAPGATRRNVTLSGVELRAEEGFRLRLGGVLLEYTMPADPCGLMEKLIGPGAKQALQDRAGLCMRVLEGGSLSVGESVSVEPSA